MALAKTLLNLGILVFLFGLCTTDESVVETEVKSDSFPTVVPEVKKLVPDDVEVVPASVNNTDFQVTHQEGSDTDGVAVEAVPVDTFSSIDEQSGKNDKYVNPDYDSVNYDSLHSRFAPPDDDLNRYHGQPYMITKERLQEVRDEFMYWYFDQGGRDGNGDHQNNIHSSTPQVHKNFNFQLPFFGFRFNYTRLSMNGYLEFSDPPEQYVYPLTFPVKEWPKKKDPAFIGIFYSKCRIGKLRPEDIDKRKPGVYFRLERDLPTRIDKFGVEFRERLMWDIREGIVGAKTFEPKHAIVATWKNMSFAGGIDSALYVTNTFQLVLATDEVYTYAIFNYLDLQWTSHTEARGDTTTGENGVSAFVGFNAGNGTQSYEYQPYSQQSVIRDLTGRGWGNGFKGRHIFRIDEKIMLGTCNKDLSLTNLPLVFAPESGNMLGGTVVNITGPCFDKEDKVVCKFDTVDVVGKVIDRNRAICIQPMLYAEGYVPLDVRVGQNKYNWKGKYFVETPATATEGIVYDGDAVHQKYPAEIKITWDRYNLTTRQEAGVRIALWGYKESTVHPEFKYIDIIQEDAGNTGVYIISPANFRTRDNKHLSELQFGFLQINLTNPKLETGMDDINPVLWSKPIPLAWYFAPQWEKKFGKKWAEKLCDKWLMNDRFLRNFAHEIPECPCKLDQAVNDKGRYLPDFDCDKDINRDCIYNNGAVHCVRSGSPSIEGSEQQCCYDKNHYLMLSYDQQWGSKPHRIHNLGYLPWNEANKVPTLSTWYHDVIPFYQCCLWQDEQAIGCETYRFEHRPTQDCVGYQGPAVATVFGDPHVVTFDGLQYTFNGKGEFVLARVNTPKLKLDVQGRFEQVPINRYGEVKATQLTAIAARGNHSATIEVRLRPKDAQWRYRLDVLANGKKVYFDRKSLKMQHFSGVTVYTPTYILNQSEVVIMFDSGAGVEVIENEGYMATRVYLPWKFINTTRGLMGNWSFDRTDDFTTPDGTFSAVTNIINFQNAHEDFAIKWLIEDNDDKLKGGALFTREFGKTSSNYANRSFVPEFRSSPEEILPSNRSDDINDAHSLCHDVYQCQYDYALTLNRDLAHFTKNYFNSYTTIQTQTFENVISCGVLETPRFGHKTTFLFVPDTTVSFECNENFHLVGDKRRKCLPNGRWNVPEYGYSECLRKQEYSSRTAGKTTAIVVAIIVPIVLILVFVAVLVLKKRKRVQEETRLENERAIQEIRLKRSLEEDEESHGFPRIETEVS